MKIKVIAKSCKTKDGKEFTAYKMVDEANKGKLIDLHFKQDVDLKLFKDMHKFIIEANVVQISENFEFPRAYVGEVDESKIVKIFQ